MTSSYKSVSGKETRILLGDTATQHELSLEFQNVLEAGVESLLSHWDDAAGEFHSFTLPSTIFAGWSLYASAVSSSQQWRYSERPKVTAVSPGIMTVSVSLIAVV